MNDILINVNDICIWIGIPKPHTRCFRLAVGLFRFGRAWGGAAVGWDDININIDINMNIHTI